MYYNLFYVFPYVYIGEYIEQVIVYYLSNTFFYILYNKPGIALKLPVTETAQLSIFAIYIQYCAASHSQATDRLPASGW